MNSGWQAPAPLYLITDRHQAGHDLCTTLEAALRGGVRLVQLREKDLPQANLLDLALRVRQLTRRYDARLLLNGDPELARQTGADGVQLGVNSCSINAARQQLGPKALIGYSAHSDREVAAAEVAGADFVTFSPIYYTASKAQYGPPQGLNALRTLCRMTSLPVYALGGVDLQRIDEVIAAGASGVAVISAIFSQPDPEAASRALLSKISAVYTG